MPEVIIDFLLFNVKRATLSIELMDIGKTDIYYPMQRTNPCERDIILFKTNQTHTSPQWYDVKVCFVYGERHARSFAAVPSEQRNNCRWWARCKEQYTFCTLPSLLENQKFFIRREKFVFFLASAMEGSILFTSVVA